MEYDHAVIRPRPERTPEDRRQLGCAPRCSMPRQGGDLVTHRSHHNPLTSPTRVCRRCKKPGVYSEGLCYPCS
jgi:hypothetical protein